MIAVFAISDFMTALRVSHIEQLPSILSRLRISDARQRLEGILYCTNLDCKNKIQQNAKSARTFGRLLLQDP